MVRCTQIYTLSSKHGFEFENIFFYDLYEKQYNFDEIPSYVCLVVWFNGTFSTFRAGYYNNAEGVNVVTFNTEKYTGEMSPAYTNMSPGIRDEGKRSC